MGFFGKSKKDLLTWQNDIMSDAPNTLIMNEKQLKETTSLQAENDIRIINDCIKIISETINPDTYFSRFNLLLEKGNHLLILEQYIKFSGASISDAIQEIHDNKQESIRNFLSRYYENVSLKMKSLKTEKGKMNQLEKFYNSLKPYFLEMNQENIDFIESTKDTKDGTRDGVNP